MNDTMTLSQRADALEEQMSRELDYIVIKSRLYSMAEGDMGPPPNAAALMKEQPERARADGRRPAPAADAGKADPDGFLQVPLRPAACTCCRAPGTRSRPVCRRRWCWPACCTTSRRSASSAATTAIGARSWSSPMSTRKSPGRSARTRCCASIPTSRSATNIRNPMSSRSAPITAPTPMSRKTTSGCGTTNGTCRAGMITVHDIYSFDPNVHVELEEFTDIIGRNFRQPEEGLGFDNSPVAHMWRAMIRPAKYL